MKKGIETYSDYDDAQVRWKLCIRKVRGKFTLDEIVEAAREWEEDFYALVLKCLDGEWEETQGDYVELYRLSDMERNGGSWVRRGDEYFCSHCGKKNAITPFCPNCGYKMGVMR